MLFASQDFDSKRRSRQIPEVPGEPVVGLDLDGAVCPEVAKTHTDDPFVPANKVGLARRPVVDCDVAEHRGSVRVLSVTLAGRVQGLVDDEP